MALSTGLKNRLDLAGATQPVESLGSLVEEAIGDSTSDFVSQTITNGVTTFAPSEDAVFDALALKAPAANSTFTGTTTFSSLTLSTVPYLDASKVLTSSAVTPTELGYVHGVTSAIQTQIAAKLTATQAANVAALTGTLTGTVTGGMADTSASACGGGATPAASDVDTCIASLATAINAQLKELQTKLNAEIAALKATNIQAAS